VTLATGIGLTVITGVEMPEAASLVAVIVAVPTAAAVTVIVAPLEVLTELDALSERTAGLLETQLTVRPVNVLPLPSFGVAVSCWVAPRTTGVVGAESASDATGIGTTVTDADPGTPSLVAMMLVVPTATAVTTPLLDTVATPVLPDDQVTTRPLSGLLFASSVVAVACVV
jgi:hypothetical protein